jgi:hypothetical protein
MPFIRAQLRLGQQGLRSTLETLAATGELHIRERMALDRGMVLLYCQVQPRQQPQPEQPEEEAKQPELSEAGTAAQQGRQVQEMQGTGGQAEQGDAMEVEQETLLARGHKRLVGSNRELFSSWSGSENDELPGGTSAMMAQQAQEAEQETAAPAAPAPPVENGAEPSNQQRRRCCEAEQPAELDNTSRDPKRHRTAKLLPR